MTSPTRTAYDVAAEVPDPELPQLTLADLGILRSVEVDEADGAVVAVITPTYSGCPAMREIGHDVRHRLEQAGFHDVEVRFQLAPAWSTEWITDEGRRKLHAAGIAPPSAVRPRTGPVPLTLGRPPAVACPRCGAGDTRQTAAFSGTACKSLHRCVACGEPFEAVKPL
ncbi:1,2-phenylacetyl-CoA epoxidase subunit PaaD [uncultured Jatrophihabitans sp.]|uniref:1,2-phenylacetyl-CoA epoxidase subunit PaaD n=1 Tax=uncultured Jatrophihabitans sp. TaxID=1610747 RepID=UPI0035CAEC7D